MYGVGLRTLVPADFVTLIIGLCFQNVEGFVEALGWQAYLPVLA
jgi:hypothetical protein